MNKKEFDRKVGQLVENYLGELGCEINDRFARERDGDGCGCIACRKQAAEDKNWFDAVSGVGRGQQLSNDNNYCGPANEDVKDEFGDEDDMEYPGWH